MPLLGQGQAQSHIAQRLQVQAIAFDFAFLSLFGAGVRHLHRHIAAWPGQALVAHKSQVAGGHAPAQRIGLTRKAPRQLRETQRPERRVQRGLHRAQVHVGRAASPFAVLDV